MKRGVVGVVATVALSGFVLVGALNSAGCDDDDDTTGAAGVTGTAGTTGVAGRGGSFGRGGAGGGAAGTGGVGGTAGATSTTYNVTLDGAHEVPMVTTTATGTATITLDASNLVTVTGAFSGLSSTATVAHIHGPATATMTADPIIPLTITQGTSGTVTGSGTLTDAQAADMRAGRTYINYHSMNHTTGEIRAQIQ